MSLGKQVKKYREQLGWTLEELESRSGVGRGTISALENRNSKKSGYAGDLAKAFGLTIEQLADESKNWLEISDIGSGQLEYVGPTKTPSLLPVAGIAQLGSNGWYDEIEANGTEGYVEHYTNDDQAYALRVRGDSMYPAIRNGWYVVVEPSMAVSGGIYAAIALTNGRKMVKEVLYETPQEYVLQSVNGGERLSISRDEIQTIHGVSAVVAPGKHKQ